MFVCTYVLESIWILKYVHVDYIQVHIVYVYVYVNEWYLVDAARLLIKAKQS